ncbi:MAG: pyrimidine 5'-nucleotidase [Burkholderiales bacterium]|nr:pyrimidine 5'-nucleotidase [Burkholderiales bacterium]
MPKDNKSDTSKYDWILFDADETLFHFNSKLAIEHMFKRLSLPYCENEYNEYSKLNELLWIKYQNHEIKIPDIKEQRFAKWANKFNLSTVQLNRDFINSMAEISDVLPGAHELLDSLHGKFNIGIITNGMIDLQEARLLKTNCKKYIDLLVISEKVGYAKPHEGIFEFAHDKMGHPDKNSVLMIGDNPDSDIIGGQRFGFDTCWYNPNNKPTPEYIKPTFTVSHLIDILKLVR